MRLRIGGALCVLFCAALPPPARAITDRPPQFVAISFDNCGELERWQELSDFLREMNAGGARLHLTFFVSGTNFLSYASRGLYRAPGRVAGEANIAFGGTPDDVRRRVAFINLLHAAGHEIGSHAVGHFDGKLWTTADWAKEFRTYNELFNDVGGNADAGKGFAFSADEIRGFRAPYLSRSPGLYQAEREFGFRYDASGVGEAAAWPEKKDGIWRFNLASLRIAGSGRFTLSMDYNFLVAQSGVAGNPRLQGQYRAEMLRTYLNYFRANYIGNRAPIHIGHHFSPIQGGAYNEALKDFARMVCGLPEVRCVSYRTIADYLDRLDATTLQAYQRGDFPRAPALDLAAASVRDPL
ncbi:MAG TPA: polysaccharide deacetylase family protein [Xanthobacteraceae bacterium]